MVLPARELRLRGSLAVPSGRRRRVLAAAGPTGIWLEVVVSIYPRCVSELPLVQCHPSADMGSHSFKTLRTTADDRAPARDTTNIRVTRPGGEKKNRLESSHTLLAAKSKTRRVTRLRLYRWMGNHHVYDSTRSRNPFNLSRPLPKDDKGERRATTYLTNLYAVTVTT